ncbi:hypothetical protein SDC9_93132 [bioreactor metagenome]|uniref:Uncharacterized protein n=1 Tax=bioreactor metagenome TaxID=1076179 RepID=A0A645A083_9ZZZZ|nr:hypothetical protein [Oscillibacter sp.]
MSARKKLAIVTVFFVVGGVLTLLGRRQESEMGQDIGVAVMLGAILLEVVLYRCPHCGRYLGWNFQPGKRCPNCGEKIN